MFRIHLPRQRESRKPPCPRSARYRLIDAEQTRQAKQAKKTGDDAEIRPRREYKDFLRLDQLKEQLERLQGIEERKCSLEAENRRVKFVLEALQKSFPRIQQGGAVDVAT